MTSKSITLPASTGLLPWYGRVAVKVKAKQPDSMHLGDLSTKHVATNGQGMPYHGGCRCPLRVGEIERDGPNPMRSQQSRKTRLFGRTLRDLFAQFSSRWPGLQKPTASAFTTRSRNECDVAGDQIPTPSSFPRFRVASKAHDVTLWDGIELATTRFVWKEPAVTMDDNFFDPPLSQLRILVVGQRTRTKARSFLLACESCDSDAEFPFDWVLDEVTGADPASTDYLIDELVSCPWCGAEIDEKTLVNWQPSDGT